MSESRRGKLLIASATMLDPNFARSVVLIVRDDEDEGAFGLVLNRTLDVTVASAIGDQVEAAKSVEAPLSQGGPCQGPLTVLHASEAVGGEQVIPGVLFTADREQIESIMWHNVSPVRYMAGYAGWSPAQLDNEIDAGAWVLTPATAEHVFDGSENLWSRLSAWLTLEKAVRWDRIPDDPSVN
jgi:putative transcriptional regulator